ncbi:sarcosine oxidase subunit alpha family protein [Kordiimonas pumila]|uniref:Sarcosine oxidase subunit alpha family protein n=1 Tax=Kordiimonas pumila TaxID=2161677 RepID=A0ABV7D9B5_9PROT|nr:sarcosine oxidase subunit alpha family protein [Kordiimonas pumila]
MSGYRVSLPAGKKISFRFDGKLHTGYEGDTLASALLANGVSVVARSFKYHRPRGILTAGIDEPNALVQLETGAETVPNVKATSIKLYDGLHARSVNAWPSAKFDLMSVTGMFQAFLPAGFYYKTFIWPDWHLFEPTIRRAAGMGKSPDSVDPNAYEHVYEAVDFLVVGGGLTGLISAYFAGLSGAKVVLVDLDSEWGGMLLSNETSINGSPASVWVKDIVAKLAAMENVRLLNNTVAFGFYDHGLIGLLETVIRESTQKKAVRQRLWKIRAKQVVQATGALERPLVFPGNDRPGIMLSSAAQAYLQRYGVACGRNAVFCTSNDSAYEVALAYVKAGIKVKAIVDLRPGSNAQIVQDIVHSGVPVYFSTAVTNTYGKNGIHSLELHQIDKSGAALTGTAQRVDCDVLLTSGGWSPCVQLFSQSGGSLAFDEEIQGFKPVRSVQKEISVGAAAGRYDITESIKNAISVIADALRVEGYDPQEPPPVTIAGGIEFGAQCPIRQIDVSGLRGSRPKAWIDFQHDVTDSDIRLALRENYRSVEHVKRYTTLGMASDQGKTSNVNAIGVMEKTMGVSMAQVGTTKFRPPYDPVAIGAMAGMRIGENLHPLSQMAAHESHVKQGAVFEDYGRWLRPVYYAQGSESEDEAIAREVMAVRNGVGIFEASPLGKIEVVGTDAAEFLNRIYVNNMKTLKPGKCRYGLMLNEQGIIHDDGILACLGENHYLVGTTSGHAEAIHEALQEWLQCEWLNLDVVTENVTTNWAVITVAGPKARQVLSRLESDISFAPDDFPHMAQKLGVLQGMPCRVQRVSFSGEVSYEVSVPWGYGHYLWELLLEGGKPEQITPFGVEALMVMRVEKGFLHVGADTDGTTLPMDVGFGNIIAKKIDDFVGRRSLMTENALSSDRRQFVGIEVLDGKGPLDIGGHVIGLHASAPGKTQGWVTSSVMSPTLGRPVALGLVECASMRIGEEVQVWSLGKSRKARLVSPCVYDPKGELLNA